MYLTTRNTISGFAAFCHLPCVFLFARKHQIHQILLLPHFVTSASQLTMNDIEITILVLCFVLAFILGCLTAFCMQRIRLWLSHMRMVTYSNAEPVWYSCNSEWGAWKHVVLYAHQHKFELRLQGESGTPSYHCKPCALPTEADLNAVGPLATLQSLFCTRPREHSYRLIGWTNLEIGAIDGICRNALGRFGSYSLASNNCQHFARDAAKDIIPKNQRAIDWPALSPSMVRLRFRRAAGSKEMFQHAAIARSV